MWAVVLIICNNINPGAAFPTPGLCRQPPPPRPGRLAACSRTYFLSNAPLLGNGMNHISREVPVGVWRLTLDTNQRRVGQVLDGMYQAGRD
ncbi:hypothetical protein Zmor_026332 [Zophobas morio]|uniref:Uncharacterized protein n=1 Tax=Zophobas morio TaxID=2755281 RepID=A0AA38HVR1_9CUCU|nr:hypothetical protein Zmor_026332 [Zophobas morio]